MSARKQTIHDPCAREFDVSDGNTHEMTGLAAKGEEGLPVRALWRMKRKRGWRWTCGGYCAVRITFWIGRLWSLTRNSYWPHLMPF